MIGLKTSLSHNVQSIPCSLETVYNTFEKIREVWISNDFLKFINQISIEFWIRNTLLHKFFFQTDMIFFDQFIVPTIKFGKKACGVYDTDSLASGVWQLRIQSVQK